MLDEQNSPPIVLSPEETRSLEAWSRSRSLPAHLIQRAQIVLKSAAGIFNHIARELRDLRPRVQL